MDVTLDLGASGGSLVEKLKEVREQLAQNQQASEAFNKAEQDSAKASIAAADEWIVKQKELLEIQAQQTSQIKNQQAAIKELKAKYEELQASSSGSLDAKAVKNYNDQIKELKKQIADLKAQIEGTGGKGKLKIFAEGSREEAIATVKQIKAELDTMNASQLKSSYGKRLAADLKEAEKELANLTKLSGQAESAGNALNKAWGFLRQAAYLLPGIGIAGIIGVLTDGVTELIQKFQNAETEATQFGKVLQSVSAETQKAIYKEVLEVTSLVAVIRDENATREAKVSAIRELNKLMPDHNNLITEENINTEAVSKAIGEYIQALDKKQRAQSYMSKLQEQYNKVIDAENKSQEENLSWLDKRLERIRALNSPFSYSETADQYLSAKASENRAANIQKELDLYRKLQTEFQKSLSNGTSIIGDTDQERVEKDFKDRSEKILQLEKQLDDQRADAQDDSIKRQLAKEQSRSDAVINQAKNNILKYNKELAIAAKASDSIQKDNEIKQLANLTQLENQVIEQEAATHAQKVADINEKAAKKQRDNSARGLKEAKDYSDKILQLEKQLLDLRISALSEGREKEVAIENAKYQEITDKAVNSVRQAQAEIEKVRNAKMSSADKKKEIAELMEIIDLQNQVEQQEAIAHRARLLAIDLKYYDDAKKALLESQQNISEVILKDEDKEINAVNSKYQKLLTGIAEARKKAMQAISNPLVQAGANFEFDTEEASVTEAQQKEILDVKKKYALKRLKQDEDLAVAEAGIIQSSGLTAVQLERVRQAAIIQVQIDYAQKKIDLLSSSTDKEDKIIVAQAKALIEKLKLELKKLGEKSAKDFNIYQLLGLNLTQKEQQDLENAAKTITDSLLKIWGSYIQQRIDQSEELLTQLQDEIEKQQDKVDKEKELKDQGLANDLEIEQSRLDDLKRRNNEQIAELKKAQKEQEAYAKAQQIIQGTVAAAKLGVAAAEYFAGGSTYGPVIGVALALAAIATMVATFASLKNQTKELSNFQTYRTGGEYDATNGAHSTHEEGGIDVVDGRSGKKLAEFEKNEYAYFFRDGRYAKQFKPLFDEINKGKLSKWHVSPQGLQLPEQAFQTIIVGSNGSPGNDKANQYLSEINTNVKKIVEPKIEVEIVDGYRIERTGNHIRKIKLHG
ncbi:MAG: hypothetical protein QM802_19885 [Agriterribacter sp.]